MLDHGVVATTATPRSRRVRPGSRATSWSSPAASRSARTTTSSRAFEACGVEEVFWRVRIKPGKPLWFGRRGDTLVFGLPGQPAVDDRLLRVFIEPALRRLAGERARAAARARPPGAPAGAVRRAHDVPHRALVPAADGVLVATPTERQGSHMTGALGESDGFAVVPDGAGSLPAGAPVACCGSASFRQRRLNVDSGIKGRGSTGSRARCPLLWVTGQPLGRTPSRKRDARRRMPASLTQPQLTSTCG